MTHRTVVTVSIDVATLEKFDAWRGNVPRGVAIGLLLEAVRAQHAPEPKVSEG